jgi:peptide/nickel transport system substrate-binding protein
VDQPELLYYPIFVAEGGFITTQAKEVAGLENTILSGADGMISPDFLEAAGDAGEGMYITGPNLNFENALGVAFQEKHLAKYGEPPLSAFHAHAWDAAMILFSAIEEVGVLDEQGNLHIPRQALREAVYGTNDFSGITGTLTCDANGDCADPSITVNQIENSEYVAIWNDKLGYVGAAAEAEGGLLDQVMAAGKLVVSTDPNYAPQSFLNDAGELDGFDVNVAQEVADRLGVEVEFTTPDWDLITAGGWAGRWDVSIGSMTPTEARSEVLWFTDPYYYTPASIAVHKDNTDITTVEDLSGKDVGLGTATTYEAWFEGTLSIMGGEIVYDPPSGVNVVPYSTDAEAIQDLALGDGVRLDAVMSAQPTIQNAIDQGQPLKYIGTPAFYEPLAFALDKSRGNSDQMLAKLNEVIADMHADGTLSELSLEWYGVDITTLVAPEAMPEMGEETLIFAQSADAGTLDPALETSANSLAPASHIYEGLTTFEPGTTTPVPSLATSWEASDDGLEWTFFLREGVTFHDGTPFDADAVIFNFERWWDTDNPYNLGADQFIYWDYMFQGFKGDENSVLAGIEKVDDMTVKLTLNVPNASLLNTLTMENFRFASPTAVQEQGENYGTAEGLAVGTGPFKVEEWLKEDHLTLLRNDDYWGEAPTLQRIVYRVIPDTSAAFLALQAGEIDMLSLWASPGPDDIAVAQEDPNLKVVYNPAFNVGYLGLNHYKEWLQNTNVRLAIAHAIDKQAIVDALYPGDAETAKEFQPPSLWGYDDAIDDYPYDPALAQEYLQAAIDEGVEIPDPAIFYVMPVSRAYYPQPQPTGELIQSYLAEIGINTEIQSPAWPDPYLSDLEEDGTKHDLFMLGWVGDNGDPDNFLCVFFCGGDTSFNNDGAGGGLPPDEEIADLLRAAVAETDFAARQAMYEQANQLIHDRIISVPIVHRTPPTLMRANVTGYVPSPVREVLTYITK